MIRRLRISLTIFLAICFAFICYGCENRDMDPALKERIINYYKLEQENKWEQTYYFHIPDYRNDVPIGNYVMGMERGMKGWQLNSIKIKSVAANDNTAVVDIVFRETNSEGVHIITEPTRWEKIDGLWYGRDVGTRVHLPFNSHTRP